MEEGEEKEERSTRSRRRRRREKKAIALGLGSFGRERRRVWGGEAGGERGV